MTLVEQVQAQVADKLVVTAALLDVVGEPIGKRARPPRAVQLAVRLFVEIESRTTTIRMTDNLIFSVEESVDAVMAKIESVSTARISNAIRQSGLVPTDKPA